MNEIIASLDGKRWSSSQTLNSEGPLDSHPLSTQTYGNLQASSYLPIPTKWKHIHGDVPGKLGRFLALPASTPFSTNNIHLAPIVCRGHFQVQWVMLRKLKAVPTFKEKLNNMSRQIHLSTSHHHTTSQCYHHFPGCPGSKTGMSCVSLPYYSPKNIYPGLPW